MFILFSLFLIVIPAQAKAEKPTICQFYLNETKAKKNNKNLSNLLNKNNVNIKVFYPKEKELGKESFERMIKSKTKCDGLIISGHHEGDFFDEKDGESIRLFLKDMEKLSCQDDYRDWFSNIKSLWLLGCNTLVDTSIRGEKKNPDEATIRILSHNPSSTSLSTPIHQQSYGASINNLTPLSSRYLRMFPETKIYGYHDSAPADHQISDGTQIFNHIARLSEILKKQHPDNQKKNTIKRGLQALLQKPCEDSLEAWSGENGHPNAKSIDHHDYTDAYELGCKLTNAKQVLENPTSTTRQKQAAKNTILKTLRQINKKDKEVTDENDDGTKNPNNKLKYSHLLFNNIYETWDISKKGNKKFHEALKKIFKEDVFSKVLEERIESPIVASISQIDYLQFYKEIHSLDIHKNKVNKEKIKFVNKHLKNIFTKINDNFSSLKNSKDDKPFSEETRSTFSLAIIDQLSQYNLLTKEEAKQFLQLKKIFKTEQLKEDSSNIYELQIKYKLENHFSNPEEIVNKVTEDLKKEDSTFLQQIVPISMATREFVKSGDSRSLNNLVKTVNKKNLEPQTRLKINSAVNAELLASLSREYPDQPTKQAEILINYINNEDSLYGPALAVAKKLLVPINKQHLLKAAIKNIPDKYRNSPNYKALFGK